MKFPDPAFCPYSLQTLVTLAPEALTLTSSHCPAWLSEETLMHWVDVMAIPVCQLDYI